MFLADSATQDPLLPTGSELILGIVCFVAQPSVFLATWSNFSRRCASPWMFVAVTRTSSSVTSSERSSASRFFWAFAHAVVGP